MKHSVAAVEIPLKKTPSLNPEILVREKNIYGKKRYEIVSSHADAIARLSGLKPYGQREIDQLKELGFSVCLAPQEKVSL